MSVFQIQPMKIATWWLKIHFIFYRVFATTFNVLTFPRFAFIVGCISVTDSSIVVAARKGFSSYVSSGKCLPDFFELNFCKLLCPPIELYKFSFVKFHCARNLFIRLHYHEENKLKINKNYINLFLE